MVVNITSRNRQSTDADELNTAQQNASHHFVSKLKVVFHFSALLSVMQSGIRIGQLNLNFGNAMDNFDRNYLFDTLFEVSLLTNANETFYFEFSMFLDNLDILITINL